MQTAIDALEEALKGEDKEAIETATAALTEASAAIAQKMYAEDAATQGDAEASGDAGADDAVDAEFEEVKDEAKDEDKK
jgi:molecular chaperone DnaK